MRTLFVLISCPLPRHCNVNSAGNLSEFSQSKFTRAHDCVPARESLLCLNSDHCVKYQGMSSGPFNGDYNISEYISFTLRQIENRDSRKKLNMSQKRPGRGMCKDLVAITITTHSYHCISKHRKLGCLFNSLFMLTLKKTSKLNINLRAAGGFPSQRGAFPRHHIFDFDKTNRSQIHLPSIWLVSEDIWWSDFSCDETVHPCVNSWVMKRLADV